MIIAFAYVTLNYILRINDSFLMVPAGLNLPTFLPVPMIFRWLYQFHSIENVGEVLAEFYERFQPYFISGHWFYSPSIRSGSLYCTDHTGL